ncbi:MAG: hypothetical protein IJI56_00470 [Firmicutes bacterium]|nr:hypothetical protein [Bacillota bacterium]
MKYSDETSRGKQAIVSLLSVALIVCCMCTSCGEDKDNTGDNTDYTINSEYEYELTPDSSEWEKLTPEERLDVCNIPLEIAEKMTTEALLRSMVHNPRISVIYFYDGGTDEGIERFCLLIPALKELFSRDDIASVLSGYIENKDELSEHEYNIAVAFLNYLDRTEK